MNNPNIAKFKTKYMSKHNKATYDKLVRFDKSLLGKTFNLDKWNKIKRFCDEQIPLPNGEKAELMNHLALPLSLIFCYDFPIREIGFFIGRSNYKSGLGTIVAAILLLLGGKPNQAMKFMAITKEVAMSEMFGHLQMVLTQGVPGKQGLAVGADNVKVPVKSKLPTRGSSVVIRGADEKRLDGGREQLIVVDELGAMAKSPLGTLRQGLDKNEGLLLVTSTNNIIRGGAWDNEIPLFRTYCFNDDFSRWSFFYELDDLSEIKDENKWVKANPGLGTSVKLEHIRRDVEASKVDTSKASIVLSKRFNLSGVDSSKYFTKQITEPNKLLRFDFTGLFGVLGSDFSVSGDTWGSVFLAKVGDTFYAKPIAIRPEEKEDAYRHLGETIYHSGKRNDSEEGCRALAEEIEPLNVVKLAYDTAYSDRFLAKFDEYGILYDRERVWQNSFKLSSTIQSLRRHLEGGTVKYVGNLMEIHLLNAKVKVQMDTEAIRLIKGQKDGKIDLTDALVNALSVWEANAIDYEFYAQENEVIVNARS